MNNLEQYEKMLIPFMLQYECLMKSLKLYFALVIPGWKCGMHILSGHFQL